MANENNCLLGRNCKSAGDETQCTKFCGLFVGLHGLGDNTGRIGAAGIPREYTLKTVSTSPVRDEQRAVYEKIDAYIQTFPRFFIASPEDTSERIKNLYLFSKNTGTGKTATSACVLNSFLAYYYAECLRRNKQPSDRPVYFLSMNSLQKDYLQMTREGVPRDLKEAAGERFYAALGYAKQAEMVVFDDIGTRSITEGLRNDVLDVIDSRQADMKPSIYTSNLKLSELPALFGEERLFDRIRDLSLVIEFTGESRRGRR